MSPKGTHAITSSIAYLSLSSTSYRLKSKYHIDVVRSSLTLCFGDTICARWTGDRGGDDIVVASRHLRVRPSRRSWSFLLLLLLWCCRNGCRGSEFPERECCDPIYPVTTSTTPAPPLANTDPPGKTGLRTSITILNCLLARQLCFEDASCSAILEIIPRVCGSELVACSTVTVTKCQAALRTLQAFPFFKPTCLCREPNVDPECNSFRDFLFDHPCVFVLKKEKDPYPVEALPTCNYALNVCHNEKSCANLYDTFKAACRARDGDCRMDDREQCREAWTGLRMSPLFGCICPNNHMKKRCDRIFAMVNHNPCVEPRMSSRGGQDLFLNRMLRLRHAPKRPSVVPPTDRHPDRFNLHPSKLPESKQQQSHDDGHRSLEFKSNVTRYVAPDGTILLVTENGTQVITDAGGGDLIRAIIRAMGHRSRASSSSRRHPNATRSRSNSVNAVSSDGKKTMPNKTSTSNNGDYVSGVDVIPDDGLEIDDSHISPHVMEEGHRRLYGRPGRRKGGGPGSTKSIYHGPGYTEGHKRIGSGEGGHGDGESDVPRVSLHSTCHLALDRCIRDKSCTTALTPVLQTCDVSRCDREGCMDALRNFYRTPNVQWNLEIAFCLCKKTDNKEDPCMNAQEKLHPVCAQREPGAPLPACHVLAQSCREQPECRSRLELYEQSCAVDSVTKKCAGSAEACRSAVLDMLGTELRTACACKGTDYTQLYDCLGWQRLLWLNPCVVESQSDFHIKTYGSGSTPSMLDNVIRTVHISVPEVTYHQHTTTIYKSYPTMPTSATIVIPIESHPTKFSNIQVEPNSNRGRNIEVEIQGSGKSVYVVPTPKMETTTELMIIEPETTPTTTTTTTTEKPTTTTLATTTTTEPIKYCIVQRPELDDQFVQKGHTKRLYRDTELDCSELCHCDGQLSVSCHAVCVQHAPCRTALAFYSHAAPAYQAYRGRCYCYSGNFICMRPNPGEYSLQPGVYLLLGFSSQDEALLRPHTRLGLEDAVRVLQEYMVSLTDDGTNCTLTLFNVTSENMIVTASVPVNQRDRNASPLALLDIDKIECIGLLETIKSKINTQDYDISSHLLLSIFKIAEVDVVYPPPSSGPSSMSQGPAGILMMLWASIALYNNHQNVYDSLLSMLHIVLFTTINICTKVFKADCLLVFKEYKYRFHKSVLAIIVAHFLYYIKRYLQLSLLCIKRMLFQVSEIGISDAYFVAYFRCVPIARLFYEKMCFLLTLALRCCFKICQIHIVSTVKLTVLIYAIILSVILNCKKVDMVMLSFMIAVTVWCYTHGPLVNLANIAFITRPKTDVFILFYKPEGLPIFLANYMFIATVITIVAFLSTVAHKIKDCFKIYYKCLDFQNEIPAAHKVAYGPPFCHLFIR